MNNCSERPHSAAASEQIRPRCARLLAKPEYFSPPDEVCCWLGRRDRAVAGRGAAAKSHREDAGGGAGEESHREDAAVGRNATGSSIEKTLPAAAESHREATASKSASIRQMGCRRRTGKYLLLRWNQGAVVAQAAGVAPV